jgi:hypothetical protein
MALKFEININNIYRRLAGKSCPWMAVPRFAEELLVEVGNSQIPRTCA